MGMRNFLIISEKGFTTLSRVDDGTRTYGCYPRDPVASIQEFEATREEFTGLMKKAETHHIEHDAATGKVVVRGPRKPFSTD